MQTITETQLILMDDTLEELMNLRLYLTKVKDVEVQDSTNENESNIDKTNDNKKKTNNKKKKKKTKKKKTNHDPTVKVPFLYYVRGYPLTILVHFSNVMTPPNGLFTR